jgi:hypothetical protein
MQRTSIGPLSQLPVGAACLGQRQRTRHRDDGIELGAEPLDPFEKKLSKLDGRKFVGAQFFAKRAEGGKCQFVG